MLRLLGPAKPVAGTRSLPAQVLLAAAYVDLRQARSVTREDLAAFLWEDASTAGANANLRQVLLRLRRLQETTGIRIWDVTAQRVSRREGEPSDLAAFIAAQPPRTGEDLARLGDLFAGDLLEGVTPSGPEAAQWLDEQRLRLRARFLEMALDGARRIGGGAGTDMLDRLAQDYPYDEAVARARMSVAARSGSAAAVDLVYAQLADRLQRDLGTAPEPATEGLRRELTSTASVLSVDSFTRADPTPVVSAAMRSVPRVLILPPADGGSDELAMLALPLVEEVTYALGQARTFAVFAPHTARQLAVAPFDSGNPYGADYIVATGVLAGRGEGHRLSVRLTDVASQEVLFNERLPLSRAALATDYSQLAAAITARIGGNIRQSEIARFRKTGSASAYVHYLLGVEELKTFDLPKVRSGRHHLEHALSLAPGFALAQSSIARSLCLEWVLLERRDMELIDAAHTEAQQALEVDPLDATAHREFGNALLYLDRLDEAVDTLEMAVELAPHHADILLNYADGLTHIGRMKVARTVMDRALALNPLAPDLYYWISGITDFYLHDYASAAAALRRMKHPEGAARVIAAVEAKNGNLEAARHHRDVYMAAHPEFRLADYRMPQRSREDREHYLEGLRLAGFT